MSPTLVRPLRWIALGSLLCVAAPVASRAADVLPQLTTILAGSDDPQLQLDILRGLTAATRDRRSAPMPAGWDVAEARLATNANAEIRTLAQSLSLKFGSTRARAALRAIASDPAAEAGPRRAALESLLAVREPGLPEVLRPLLKDPAVRAVALRGLAAYDDPGTPTAILAVYGSLDGGERRDALNTLASRPAYARPLVEAVASGTVPRNQLTADLVRQLRSLKDPALAARLTEIWGVMRETSPDMTAEVERVKRLYWAGGSQPGDAPRGRVVFNQICAQCHHLFDTGGEVGPDITGANRGDLDYLLQNILFPNAVIPNEYRATTVETKDGRTLTGVLKARDANGLRLQTANELVTVTTAEVARVEQAELSMMPEGLLTPLQEQQIRDLLYYLGRPGQVNLPVPQ
ncbi:MAG: c-type cytochrome [Verrucomicrobiales bacterium]|nr:c-type cytochrome [Verrucomicrobiales bacterium]